MKRRTRIGVVGAALVAAAAGCGYPTFSYGPGNGGGGGSGGQPSSSSGSAGGGGQGGAGGAGASSSTTSASSGASTSASGSSSTSASSTGGPTCAITHLLISEVRSRGPGGASDDFIELYNPTSAPIQLDSSWIIEAIKVELGSITYSKRWVGNGSTIKAHGHYLIAANGYTQAPTPDDALAPSITDATGVHLVHGGGIVDILCYYKDLTTQGLIAFYACEGTAVLNPHDDTASTDTDQSLERRPGGNLGHCVDTNDNSADFIIQAPATPKNAATPPQPP